MANNEAGAAGQRWPVLAVRVFLPFALGYFLSYLYRTVNAVIGPGLAVEMNLDAGDLGFLTSAYFVTFAAAQVPLGIFLDSHGPRRVEAFLLIIAAAGAFLFAVGDGLAGLAFGRALIGLGVAACLMGSFKAIVEWFPRDKIPMANGFIMASGGLGAISATAPTEILVAEFGWRSGFIAVGIATLAAAAILWFVVPERQRGGSGESFAQRIGGLRTVYRSLRFWRLAPMATVSQGSFLAVQTLWAGPWLRDIAGLDSAAVSYALLAGAVGFIIGNLSIGYLSGRLSRNGIRPLYVSMFGMVLFMLVQVAIISEWTSAPELLWLLFGMVGTSGIVLFAVMSHEFPEHLSGRASTCMNLLVFLGAFALQWGIGLVINQWPVTATGSYDPQGYRVAFIGLLVMQVAAAVWLLLADRMLRRRDSASAEGSGELA